MHALDDAARDIKSNRGWEGPSWEMPSSRTVMIEGGYYLAHVKIAGDERVEVWQEQTRISSSCPMLEPCCRKLTEIVGGLVPGLNRICMPLQHTFLSTEAHAHAQAR